MSVTTRRNATTWIRTQQRVLTAVFPHNANRKFLIPNRGKYLTGPLAGQSKPGASGPGPS